MRFEELHELVAESHPAGWRLLPLGPYPADAPDPPAAHHTRAVLRADVDVALEWGMRESSRDYFEPWLGNLGRLTEVRPERILLDLTYRGALVDRLLGLAFEDFLLPLPRARVPRVKGLPDRFFPRAAATLWGLAHELDPACTVSFDRAVHRSGLRVE
ncbi:hypothetical protein [Patulibacter sp. SYSU D01012]|uniref:hypothetical protein n=1 Tax=Patulibacter sp. SYSU D01012 TaxID=2817381 RepID=UPI001B311A94|nr:hypothetical protein [Patulibacter sp. SYSU D01012]